MPSLLTPTVDELARVLREPGGLDALVARDGADLVAAAVRRERVGPLLAFSRPDVPWLAIYRPSAILEEAAQHDELVRICDALGAHGLRAAIMKGGALGYTLYPAPWCRPRLDLDLLVKRRDRDRVFDALGTLGYVRAPLIPGEFANHQDVVEQSLAPNLVHQVDVHWEATNRAALVRRVPAAGLLARAKPAPYAGPHGRDLDPIDALIVACLHRVAHHSRRGYLIWWWDLWLLAGAIDASQAAAFAERAIAAGIASLCAHDLAEARRLFGSDGGALLEDEIERLSEAGRREPTRRLLEPGRSVLGDVIVNLAALPRWRDRAQLLREHLFPPASFIRASYGPRPTFLLPWLYVRRILSGGSRWIRDALRR